MIRHKIFFRTGHKAVANVRNILISVDWDVSDLGQDAMIEVRMVRITGIINQFMYNILAFIKIHIITSTKRSPHFIVLFSNQFMKNPDSSAIKPF